jgi:hypothetical protein
MDLLKESRLIHMSEKMLADPYQRTTKTKVFFGEELQFEAVLRHSKLLPSSSAHDLLTTQQ